jgi:hypothetical protein
MSTQPLIITPETTGSKTVDDLLSYLNWNQDFIAQQLRQYGAILFRGF